METTYRRPITGLPWIPVIYGIGAAKSLKTITSDKTGGDVIALATVFLSLFSPSLILALVTPPGFSLEGGTFLSDLPLLLRRCSG